MEGLSLGEDILAEKKQELSTKLSEKIAKERQLLEIETSLRKKDIAFEKMRRVGTAEDNEDRVTEEAKRNELVAAKNELKIEIVVLRNSIKSLQQEILDMLSPEEGGFVSDDPSPVLESMFPFLMLPVRLETKFLPGDNGVELRVRIYPDDIAIQTHEPSLTEAEYAAGCRYIERIWWAGKSAYPADTADDIPEDVKQSLEEEWNDRWNTAWLEIANEYSPERAAYIVQLFRPNELEKFTNDSGKITTNIGNIPSMVPLDRNGNPMEDGHTRPTFATGEDLIQNHGIRVHPDAWSEPPRSFVMPDFFVVRLYKNGKMVFQKMGNPVPSPLHVGPAPIPTTDDPDPDEVLFFDAASSWVVKYQEAVVQGMAITITDDDVKTYTDKYDDIDYFDLTNGFDYVVAIGVRASSSPEDNKKLIEDLIENHRFTEGFSFVKQGTPTNNVVNSESGYNRTTDPMAHYEREFGPDVMTGEDSKFTNGDRLAKALGIDLSTFQHNENADTMEDTNAQHMINALWPSTMGYYLKKMLAKPTSWTWSSGNGDSTGFEEHFEETFPDIVDHIKNYFLDFVRGRGPLSAIRVGDNPYGILPATSLRTWAPSSADFSGVSGETESKAIFLHSMILKILDKLSPLWRIMSAETENVPYAGGITDPDDELVTILGMGPSSRDALIRPFVTIFFLYGLFWFWRDLNWAWISEWMGGFLETMGMPVDVDWLNDFEDEYRKKWEYYREKFKDLHDDDEDSFPDLNPLILNLVAWGKGYQLSNLRRTVGTPETPDGEVTDEPPLYPFVQTAPLTEEPLIEGEDYETRDYIDHLLEASRDALNSETDETIECNSLLYNLLRVSRLMIDEEDEKTYGEFDKSLEILKELPSAELERLLGETLDLFTNRLDAVITSVATKRLHNMRKIAPEGIHIGAYGWVENLKKDPPGSTRAGGYIVAPTHDQAAAGAILRNAFLTHTEEEEKPTFDIRLTSDRTRRAMWLLDGIREGQPLSALLGYRFEKALFENHPQFIDTFGSCVYEFRNLYPLETLHEERPEGVDTETVEVVVPRNVVDGLKLLEAWTRTKNNEENPIPFNNNNVLPNLNTERQEAIALELDCIEDALDAINDLAIYENIYHNIRGNFDRAPALLDALAGSGGVIPEPESILTPRKGFTFKHRVLTICSWNDELPASDWPNRTSPRTVAAPVLSRWVGNYLGNPANILCRCICNNVIVEISLGELSNEQNLGPLDFLAMAAFPIGGGASELESRIKRQAVVKAAALTWQNLDQIRIDFRHDENWAADKRSFLEIIPLAKRLHKLVSESRALEPIHLLHPESADGDPSSIYSEDEIDTHLALVESILQQLDSFIISLQADPITVPEFQVALLNSSLFGVRSSVPKSDTIDTLSAQAQIVVNELSNRMSEATTLFVEAICLRNAYYPIEAVAEEEERDPSNVRKSMNRLAACMNCIFGTTFKTLPSFIVRNKEELKLTTSVLNAQVTSGVVDSWLQRAAHTHEKLSQYENTMILSESFTGINRLNLNIGQLPHPENNHWLANPLDGINLEDMQQGSLSL